MDNEQIRVRRTGTQAGVGGVVTAGVAVLVAYGISKGVEIPEQVTDVVTTEMLIPGAIALVGLAVGVGTRITTSVVERLSARWPWIARLNGPEGTPTYIEQNPGEALKEAGRVIVADVTATLAKLGDAIRANQGAGQPPFRVQESLPPSMVVEVVRGQVVIGEVLIASNTNTDPRTDAVAVRADTIGDPHPLLFVFANAAGPLPAEFTPIAVVLVNPMSTAIGNVNIAHEADLDD